jgi:hypothetical protein
LLLEIRNRFTINIILFFEVHDMYSARIVRARNLLPIPAFFVAVAGVVGCDRQVSPPGLSKEEEVTLRGAIYTRSEFEVDVPTDGPQNPQPVLTVPRRVKDIHRDNRTGTLRLLLDVVKGGRPRDALTAYACAQALEGRATLGG